MKFVPDRIHGLGERPHYEPNELDREFEKIASAHLRKRHGSSDRALSTDDLTVLVEEHVRDLELYADLSSFGSGVEGVTSFVPGSLPSVYISEHLGLSENRENRLRTTLAHEFGHVQLHRYIIDLAISEGRLERGTSINCRRETILSAPRVDWREWQASYACGALLMPQRRLKQKVNDWRNSWSGAPKDALTSLVERISDEFRVSKLAAEVRLRVLGIATQSQLAA